MIIKQPTYADAINALVSGAEFRASGIDDIEWLNGTTPIPTAEIQTKLDELTADYEASAYAIARQDAYPTIKEQLDMMYHDQVNGTTTWKDAINAIKQEIPKGGN